MNTGEAEERRSERIYGLVSGLTASLERAVQAIARDSVGELAAEIREQQMHCAELRPLVAPNAEPSVAGRVVGVDPVVSGRLKEAWQRLRAGNREYAAVLAYSGESLRILASFHEQVGGYGGQVAVSSAGSASGAGWQG